MKYTKPYLLWPSSAPYKHYAIFPTKERRTNSYIFTYGRKLPFEFENSDYKETLQDPKDYDLKYLSHVTPEVFLKYDFLPTDKSALVVNKKVINILTTLCPDDIQLFPAIIVPANSKMMSFENHDYWVLNLTKTVAVLDEENSVFEQWESGNIKEIKKLIYKENSMGDVHIGRQYNDVEEVIVSPELVKIFKKEKVIGVKFKKDFEYLVS